MKKLIPYITVGFICSIIFLFIGIAINNHFHNKNRIYEQSNYSDSIYFQKHKDRLDSVKSATQKQIDSINSIQ